jgi:hypothetical protein
MKSTMIVSLLAASVLTAWAFAARQAVAQPAPVAGISGFAPSSVAGCPNIVWRVARHADGKINGIFWFSDLSGASEAVGTEDATGHFHLQLTSAIGKGPVGVVDGTRSSGKVVADLKGEGCANNHVMRMVPVIDINKEGTLASPG